jgi:serine phosphatase RsbU (regulator of sigma subunit)
MKKNDPSSDKISQYNYIDLLFGSRGQFSLEHRLFNSICLFSALAASFATITNIVLRLNIQLTLFTLVSSIVLFIFYYLTRKRKIFKPLVTPFIIFSLAVLSAVWFFNAGSEGPVVFIYLLGLILSVIITEGRNRILVISFFMLNLIVLFTLERKFPELITTYEHDTIKFYDISITFLFSFILIYLVVAILVNSYREEKRLSTIQHEKLLFQKKQITDSIQYAKNLQSALLPNQNTIKKIIPEHFIFYLPKDIVSGDFYWVKKINQRIVIAAVDCTGHGVPGAFMSVLGITLLNEIIRRESSKKANQALEILRHNLKNNLHQTDEGYLLNNGMDIALCIIDTENKILQYSGANAPLYYIRDDKLTEIKGTRNPIGITPIEIPFQYHEIEYRKDDIFYLFSDGFIDQFGGDYGKKYRSRRFKHLLLKIHDKPLDEQKKLLIHNYKNWTHQKYEQLDDIMIFGFKL